MSRINSRFSIIDGWLIDVKKKVLVNPKEADALQGLIYRHHLIDWNDIYDEEFNIYCEDDQSLFTFLEVEKYWFQIEPVTGSVVKVSKVDLGNLVCLLCHKLPIGNKKTLYIHYHPYEKNTIRTCQMKYMHKDLKQQYYPLCTFKGKMFIEIEGFTIKLNKLIKKQPEMVELTLFDTLSSSENDGLLSVNDWYPLGRVFKGRSLLYLRLINSNFFVVKDVTLFLLSFQQVLVKLIKVNGYYVCEKYHGQRTIDQATIHLAIPITCYDNRTKYIIWKESMCLNTDVINVGRQLDMEMRIAARLLDNEIITLENYFLQDKQFSIAHRISDQSVIDSIASTCTVVSQEIATQKCGSLANQSILQRKIRDTSTHLSKRDSTFVKLSKVIYNFCFTESMTRLQWWQECIRIEFDASGFDAYHQNCNEVKQNINKAIEFFLPSLITEHQGVFQRYIRSGSTNSEILKRYLIVDKFVIDIRERRVVNPLGDDIFRISSFRDAKLNLSDGLMNWSSLLFDYIPYPVFSPILFRLIDTEEFELMWDESSQGFVKVDCGIKIDPHLIVRRKGIRIDFQSYGERYLYQGEAEDLQRLKPSSNSTDVSFVDGHKDSERLAFIIDEMERIKSLHEQFKLVEESFNSYFTILNFGGLL